MLKKAKKIVMSILLVALIFSTMAYTPFASPMPDNTNITIGQNFDGLTTNDLPNYVWDLASPATKAIVDGGNPSTGRMLQVQSPNGGEIMPGVKLLSFTDEEKASDANATAVVFYLKTDDMTPPNGGKTQIQLMMGEESDTNPGNMGSVYFFGKYGDDLKATSDLIYIDKDGNVTHDAAAPFVAVPGGFEGWVIVPFDHFVNHPAYADANGKFDPDRLFSVMFDIQASTKNSSYYLDDIGVTSDVNALVKSLRAPETPPAGVDFFMGQGFGDAVAGQTTADIRAGGFVGNNSGTDMDYKIVNDVLPDGNALELSPSTGATTFSDIMLNFPNTSAVKNTKALVFRLKTPGLVDPNPFLLTDLMLMECKNDNRGDVGEVYMYYNTYSQEQGNATTITFADSKTNKYVNIDLTSPYCIPGNFDGWMIVPFSYFKQHPGYVYPEGDGKLDPDLVTRLQIEFDTPAKAQPYYVDNIGFTNDVSSFLASIGSAPAPVDKTITQTTDATSAVTADDFTYAKNNGTKLTINVNNSDGYIDYSWLFNGADITNPASLNPKVDFSSANEAAIKALTGNQDAFYLSFAQQGAFPGKATVSAYVGDDYADGTNLYLYNYNKADDKIELVSENVAVANGGYAAIEVATGSDYFLTDKKVTVVTPTPTATPTTTPTATPTTGDDSNSPTPTTGTNPKTGDNGFVYLSIVLMLSGIGLFSLRKKAKQD